ncbi:hypothetical protein [Peloplasma aerotolerans]|jgi:hypothetical protein|uniref:Uncharacterized protein n=1 Tax=Peloplasma aerotolerans TaxID=3044389 RepID=A0AAW6U9C6_9MOLU|nr:hypothetical protein [Mariniplasma sp. M4Ah]MDI6452274.1 hypothetical protein [Mariniplasma sp. M4Ah]MDR4968399.1 hypothetical protein [Acholeplasmataceae bacterium]
MKFSEMLKEPIQKGDIMPVIRQGIFMSLMGGLLIGSLHLLFTYLFNFSLTWLMLFILAFLTAKRIKGAYIQYHILYSILTVFFFFLAYYFMSITLYGGLYFLSGITEFRHYVSLFNPLIHFEFLNPFTGYFFAVENLFELLFFIIGTIYAYRHSK